MKCETLILASALLLGSALSLVAPSQAASSQMPNLSGAQSHLSATYELSSTSYDLDSRIDASLFLMRDDSTEAKEDPCSTESAGGGNPQACSATSSSNPCSVQVNTCSSINSDDGGTATCSAGDANGATCSTGSEYGGTTGDPGGFCSAENAAEGTAKCSVENSSSSNDQECSAEGAGECSTKENGGTGQAACSVNVESADSSKPNSCSSQGAGATCSTDGGGFCSVGPDAGTGATCTTNGGDGGGGGGTCSVGGGGGTCSVFGGGGPVNGQCKKT